MIHYYYGKNDFFLDRAVGDFLLENRDIPKRVIEGKDVLTLPTLSDACGQQGLFSKKTIILCRDVVDETYDKELISYLIDVVLQSESCILIFIEHGDPSSALAKALKKNATTHVYNPLSDDDLIKWIKTESLGMGMTVKNNEANILIGCTGPVMHGLHNEIKKLSAYVRSRGGDPVLEKKDIDMLVAPYFDTTIFRLLDAITGKDVAGALKILEGHFGVGIEGPYLISMLAYQIRTILIVHSALMMKKTSVEGVHPFVFKKISSIIGRFPLSEARSIYLKLLDLDRVVKSFPKETHKPYLSLFVAGASTKR